MTDSGLDHPQRELLDCPFCGRQPHYGIQGDAHGAGQARGPYVIECCHARVCEADEASAVAKWNTRRAPAAGAEPNWRHPKLQALIGAKARREIELQLIESILTDPDTAGEGFSEYWHDLHDRILALRRVVPVSSEVLDDAVRFRWGVKNARWLRHEHEAYVAIPVALESDLSCEALRVQAVDAARRAEASRSRMQALNARFAKRERGDDFGELTPRMTES